MMTFSVLRKSIKRKPNNYKIFSQEEENAMERGHSIQSYKDAE